MHGGKNVKNVSQGKRISRNPKKPFLLGFLCCDNHRQARGDLIDTKGFSKTDTQSRQQQIPETQAFFHESNHPIAVAIKEALGVDYTVIIYPFHEEIGIFRKDADTVNRKICTLMTGGTVDDWILWHASGEPVPRGICSSTKMKMQTMNAYGSVFGRKPNNNSRKELKMPNYDFNKDEFHAFWSNGDDLVYLDRESVSALSTVLSAALNADEVEMPVKVIEDMLEQLNEMDKKIRESRVSEIGITHKRQGRGDASLMPFSKRVITQYLNLIPQHQLQTIDANLAKQEQFT